MPNPSPPGGVRKPTRSIAGVTPLTVVLEPRKCDHGTCIFCPGGDFVPQSYTDKSPAVMRAMKLHFDPFEQVKRRLKVLQDMNHPTEKIEIIVLGGTFLQYPKKYKYDFIKACYDALNGEKAESLEEAQKINENAEHRCVALCIENRPDNCSDRDIKEMREFGCTRVELGVQILDDEIYKKIVRGHTIQDVIDATKRLRNAGFKIGYHIMPGLPWSGFNKDLEKFKMVFENEDYKPDQLKIYPCQIVKSAPLERMYKDIGYEPYDEETTKKIVEEMMKLVPRYCRVMRIMREIPGEYTAKGIKRLEVRKDVEEEFRKQRIHINEIRFREIGFALSHGMKINEDLELKITEYSASEGNEYFLEIVNKDDILFGLLRLRIFDDIAFIREIHVYGQALKLGEISNKASQHKGLGKWLMEEAEKIVKENNIHKISVISGIGVREYYRKLGYHLENTYMVKDLKESL